jgi:hypothetical protein
VSEATEITPATGPVILHQGHYRLYEKPDGTLRIQYRRDDKDEDDFIEFPGQMVRLAKAAADGKMNPMTMMKSMAKMMGGFPNGG